MLLCDCGASTYKQIKSVLTPKALDSVDFKEIVATMSVHLQPCSSETIQHYLLHSSVRRPHKSIPTDVAEHKKLSEHCEFVNTLDPMLRDHLVCRIAGNHWQKPLLAEEKLTSESALTIALALKAADRQVKDLHNATATQVQVVLNLPVVKNSSLSYQCGGPRQPTTCRLGNSIIAKRRDTLQRPIKTN